MEIIHDDVSQKCERCVNAVMHNASLLSGGKWKVDVDENMSTVMHWINKERIACGKESL